MSNNDYQLLTDKELIDRAEQGELSKNPELYAEFMRRMDEFGTSYSYTPEDIERWKADVAASAKRIEEFNRNQQKTSGGEY